MRYLEWIVGLTSEPVKGVPYIYLRICGQALFLRNAQIYYVPLYTKVFRWLASIIRYLSLQKHDTLFLYRDCRGLTREFDKQLFYTIILHLLVNSLLKTIWDLQQLLFLLSALFLKSY